MQQIVMLRQSRARDAFRTRPPRYFKKDPATTCGTGEVISMSVMGDAIKQDNTMSVLLGMSNFRIGIRLDVNGHVARSFSARRTLAGA